MEEVKRKKCFSKFGVEELGLAYAESWPPPHPTSLGWSGTAIVNPALSLEISVWPLCALVSGWEKFPADRFQILCICWLSKYKFLMEEGEETNALSAETEIDITSSLVWSADISIRVRKAKAGNITCLMSLTSSCHTHYSWKCSSQINIYGDHFA